MCLQVGEQFDDIFSRFETDHERHRKNEQTDGQNCTCKLLYAERRAVKNFEFTIKIAALLFLNRSVVFRINQNVEERYCEINDREQDASV